MMLRWTTSNSRLCLMAASEACVLMKNCGPTATVARTQSRKARTLQLWQSSGLSSCGITKEDAMTALLRSKMEASKAVVQDISGGCGSMYKIEVESPLFRGKGLVAQHRMVKSTLKAEIADMHGLTLHTRPSPA